jgi:drug/metabolite transporter (DMT)-like permease
VSKIETFHIKRQKIYLLLQELIINLFYETILSNMSAERRAYLELHFAVFLYGFTAILGKLIQLSTIMLIWWRLLIACIVFLLIAKVWQNAKQLPKAVLRRFGSIGILIAVHWMCFYGAIKYANASVALLTFSLTSLFSAILEPLLNRQPIKKHEIGLSIIILPAIVLVGGELPTEMNTGFFLGILAAFLGTLFSIANQKSVHLTDPFTMNFVELSASFIFISILIPILYIFNSPLTQMLLPTGYDWFYLFVLALMCTNLAYTLTLRAMKYVSAFTANLAINLEPVYGITMAIVLLHEDRQLTPSFYIGGLIILLTVMSYPYLKSKFERKPN